VSDLQFAADESETFGLNIWRCGAGTNLESLLDTQPAADLVVVRDLVGQVQKNSILARGLADAAMRDLILTFRKDLRADNMMQPTGVACEVLVADTSDNAAIQKICEENFAGYPGHYQLSPYLDEVRAANGMISWLEQLRRQDDEGLFVVKQGEKVLGVLGYAYQAQQAELAVAAISAEAGIRQRNLLLVEATRRVEQRLLQRGFRKFSAKTQATNLAIQRDLVRYVFCEPAATLATFHVHLFLAQLAEKGEDFPFAGGLRSSILGHAENILADRQVSKLHGYQVPDTTIVRLKSLQLSRRDGATAMFCAGYDARENVVAVASALSG